MNIVFNYNFFDFRVDENRVSCWLKDVVKFEKKQLGEIIYFFCTKEEILEINREFLNHNYLTDIISFDNSFLNRISGEIYICPEVIESNAKKYKVTFKGELNRVLVHGVLHLIGYDDMSDYEIEIMRKKEDEYLCYLESL